MAITFKQATLANKLTIIAEVDPHAHTAAAGFFVKTGARDEDPAIMGVSHFLEHMMFKGTATRDAEAVDRDFDDLGANHNAFTTSELTAFYAHVLPEYLEQGSAVLADIMRPSLREADFNTERNVILEEIAMYQDNPFWVLYEATMERYYRDNPLGHRVLGTTDTIGRLEQNAMVEYFNRRYSADNTVIALAGNLDFDRMVDRFGAWCGDWPVTNAARAYHEQPPASDEFVIESAHVAQAYGLMIAPAPPVQDDRRYAAAVLSQILGDADGSRLYWALIDTGLAEEVMAQAEARDGTGEMYMYYSCAPDKADMVESVIAQEIKQLVDGLTEDDLQRVRSKIATAVTLHGERPAGRMRRIGQVWSTMGEYLPLEEELSRIEAVTLHDLREVQEAFPITPHITGRLRPVSG